MLPAVETLHLTYPDGADDAEALIVDPVFGDIVIIAKSLNGGNVNVYQAPAHPAAGSTTALTKVGRLALGTGLGNAVTAADATADGKVVAVRTYGRAWSMTARRHGRCGRRGPGPHAPPTPGRGSG